MPSLDVISVNIWQIIISLCNLVILYVVLRKFLYRPVKKVMDDRKAKIEKQYADAQSAQDEATADKQKWQEKLSSIDAERAAILDVATRHAENVSKSMVAEAKKTAGNIIDQARRDAEAEKEKAKAEVASNIVELSAILSEKLLQREINENDHRALIDEFIEGVDSDANGD